MNKLLLPILLMASFLPAVSCFESSRFSTPANNDVLEDAGSGSGSSSEDDEDDFFGGYQSVSFGDDQSSPVSFFKTDSYRFIISQNTVIEGGYRDSSNFDFYINNNHFDLILEVE